MKKLTICSNFSFPSGICHQEFTGLFSLLTTILFSRRSGGVLFFDVDQSMRGARAIVVFSFSLFPFFF
jgi:hypothetical protein